MDLLSNGNPAAAEQLLARAVAADPASRSLREAHARAQFDAGRYADAQVSFAEIVSLNPADDYAQFGLGVSAFKTGDHRTAVKHLALAAAMRPDIDHYEKALRRARAARTGPR
jgi:tetratricopeptide (TPR) repeat protein